LVIKYGQQNCNQRIRHVICEVVEEVSCKGEVVNSIASRRLARKFCVKDVVTYDRVGASRFKIFLVILEIISIGGFITSTASENRFSLVVLN
jgi:hypothetical protein